ncbi:MAG TPA: MipA/OmpV family protein [Burkholderiaceae bacterium]|nr:MipA/OmpV family protein [Burkholderiaceae bacterium]
MMTLLMRAAAAAEVANDEALVDLVAKPGGAGFGVLVSSEQSPYRGVGLRHDVLPVYLYEGERIFVRTDRAGLKFTPTDDQALELYLRRRFEGFPLDDAPPALQGLVAHRGGVDLGLTWRARVDPIHLHASVSQNLSQEPRGQELAVGAYTDWPLGRLTLRPAATGTWRSSRSNDFYFGVPAEHASAGRPEYHPGAGVDLFAGIYASYQLSAGWRLFAGAGTTRRAATVQASPIVEAGPQAGIVVGATYNLEAQTVRTQLTESPLIVRVLSGQAAIDRCNIVRITTLQCTTIDRTTPTEIAGLAIGKTLVESLNGWPLDVAGFVGIIVHRDRPYQRDGGELNLFVKGVFRGFPWSDRVLTRIGFGWGLSISDPVPYAEVAEQASRGRLTSRLLNYVEPSIDISIGDVIGKPEWKQTFIGLSVTHRSGIFGTSRLLGNVNGGSNYVTIYLEHSI